MNCAGKELLGSLTTSLGLLCERGVMKTAEPAGSRMPGFGKVVISTSPDPAWTEGVVILHRELDIWT